jgi:hypothetical protein
VKRLAPLFAALAVLALIITVAAMATETASSGVPSTSVELDIDAPKHPKLKAPTGPKVTAPALRVPTAKRR